MEPDAFTSMIVFKEASFDFIHVSQIWFLVHMPQRYGMDPQYRYLNHFIEKRVYDITTKYIAAHRNE